MDNPLQGYMDARYSSAEYQVQYTGASGVLLRASHILMERGIKAEQNRNVLEIGGGAMPHYKWMNTSNMESMTISDDLKVHQRPLAELTESMPSTISLKLHDYATDPDFANVGTGFTRIVASHVLEHISRPEEAIRLWTSLLTDNGVISIAIPCDPGWFWRFGQVYSFKRNHPALTFEEYDLLLSREHVNSVQRLLKMLRFYFSDLKLFWFPFLVPVVDFNLACVITCRKANLRTN